MITAGEFGALLRGAETAYHVEKYRRAGQKRLSWRQHSRDFIPEKKRKMPPAHVTRGRSTTPRNRRPSMQNTPRSRSRGVKPMSISRSRSPSRRSKTESVSRSRSRSARPADRSVSIATASTDTVRVRASKGKVTDKGVANFMEGNVVNKQLNKFNKMSYPGFVTKHEYVGNVSDQHACYIAHTSMPTRAVLYAVAGGFLKQILRSALGWVVSDPSSLPPTPYTTSPVFELHFFYKDQQTDSLSEYFSYSYSTGHTFSTIVGLFADAFYTWYTTLPSFNPHCTLNLHQVLPKGPDNIAWEMDMSKAKVHLLTECSLKIRNNSSGEAVGGTILDLDAEPIIGRSYKVKGQAIVTQGRVTPAFEVTPDYQYGVQAETATNVKFTELPLRSSIVGCSKVGSVGLNPAEYKSHMFGARYDKNLNSFLDALQFFPGVKSYRSKLGETVMFGFEKPINTPGDIVLVFEHTMSIAASVSFKPCFATSQENFGLTLA